VYDVRNCHFHEVGIEIRKIHYDEWHWYLTWLGAEFKLSTSFCNQVLTDLLCSNLNLYSSSSITDDTNLSHNQKMKFTIIAPSPRRRKSDQRKAIVRWWDAKWDGNLLAQICENFHKSQAFLCFSYMNKLLNSPSKSDYHIGIFLKTSSLVECRKESMKPSWHRLCLKQNRKFFSSSKSRIKEALP